MKSRSRMTYQGTHRAPSARTTNPALRAAAGYASAALTIGLVAAPGGGPVAHAAEGTPSGVQEGLNETFAASNGEVLELHKFEGGDKGTMFFFDGDGTTNFDRTSASTSGANSGMGYVQGIRDEAAAQGFDLIFVDHPQNGSSWWNGVDADASAVAVKELVNSVGSERTSLVGYSGGAEFIARHLLINGSDWVPGDTRATMIGGGGVAARNVQSTAGQENPVSMSWVTGENDSYGSTSFANWSPLNAASEAKDLYNAAGYQSVEQRIVPNADHNDYNFAGIVADELSTFAQAPTQAGGSSDDRSPQVPTQPEERAEATADQSQPVTRPTEDTQEPVQSSERPAQDAQEPEPTQSREEPAQGTDNSAQPITRPAEGTQEPEQRSERQESRSDRQKSRSERRESRSERRKGRHHHAREGHVQRVQQERRAQDTGQDCDSREGKRRYEGRHRHEGRHRYEGRHRAVEHNRDAEQRDAEYA